MVREITVRYAREGSMNLLDEPYSVAAALTAAGIRYAVCGGVAVTIHGATRSTKDSISLIAPSQLPEGPLRVVSRATLIRMKRLAGRAQDIADIEKLEAPDDHR
jgi:hypothetical protein